MVWKITKPLCQIQGKLNIKKVKILEKILVQFDPKTCLLNNIEYKFILLTLHQSMDIMKSNGFTKSYDYHFFIMQWRNWFNFSKLFEGLPKVFKKCVVREKIKEKYCNCQIIY